jgi:hypothetical protein
MATQTRQTTRRSARFFRATVKACMVTACCGLVLMSTVAAHAAWSPNGVPLQGMPIQGLPLNGTSFNGIGPNGIPTQGMPRNRLPLNGMPLHGHPAHEGSRSTEQIESLPWSTLSHRPLGEAAAPSMRDGRDIPPVALPEVR